MVAIPRPSVPTEYVPVNAAFGNGLPADELASLTPLVRLPAPSAVNSPARKANPEPELLSPCVAKNTYCPFKLPLPNCTVMGAEAVKVAFDFEVAVTVMDSLGGESGAVYRPVVLTDPQVALTAQPFTLQLTAVLLSVEVTVGVNCTEPPAPTVALVGLIEMVTVGAVRVTVADAVFVVSACDIAVTATVVVLGKTVGAV